MEYRELGRTGEKVPTIGMGTWGMGSYSSSEERAHQVQALRRGIELGMTLIDTAEMYASGRSEEVVGEAVRGNRSGVFIATKVSPEHLLRADVMKACEASLRRLGTSCIDLYQVHWPNRAIPIKETMAAMEDLVSQGKIRYIGVSNFSPAETTEARDALTKNEIVSNQIVYSLANHTIEAEVLPYCVREKLTLIAYSPLNQGKIDTQALPKALLLKYGITPAQMILNWVTRNKQVVAIPKTTNLAHLEENASSVAVRFDESEYQQIA